MAKWRGETYQQYNQLADKLQLIFSDAKYYCIMKYGKEVEVTSIYRSEEDQKRICKEMGVPFYATPHTDYRALDFIIPGATPEIYKDVEEYINIFYPYGKEIYKTALYHQGTGFHIHLQVKSGTI